MTTIDKALDFERARYSYCKELFDKEVSRKEMLEKKAQYYLTLITLFLGAIFLNLKSFSEFLKIMSMSKPLTQQAIYIILIFLCTSLLFSLFTILQSIRLRKWKSGYLSNAFKVLFSPDSKCLVDCSEIVLLQSSSLEYILAWEHNKQINDLKAKWTEHSSRLLLFAILMIFIIIGIVIQEYHPVI